jgi:hypothetical protein
MGVKTGLQATEESGTFCRYCWRSGGAKNTGLGLDEAAPVETEDAARDSRTGERQRRVYVLSNRWIMGPDA